MKKPIFLSYLLIVLLTSALYSVSLRNGFLQWDDDHYIVHNPLIRLPLGKSLGPIWTEPYYANYHPLHLLSYALDYRIWGLNPFGFHLTNLILYLLSALLLFNLLRIVAVKFSLPARLPILATLLFIAHPVHSEVICWLSARKDLLSFLLILISFRFYLKYRGALDLSKISWAYLLSLLFFVLALLAKVMVIPYPVFLILFDLLLCRRNLFKSVLSALPFLIGALFFSILVLMTQQTAGGIQQAADITLGHKILTQGYIWGYYLRTLFIPFPLSANYDITFIRTVSAETILYILLFIGVTIICLYWLIRRKVTGPAFLLLFFLTFLAPVSAFIPLTTLVADRYLFIPSLAASIALAGLIPKMVRVTKNKLPHLFFGLYFLLFCLLTLQRQTVWHNDQTIWEDAVMASPLSFIARINLSAAYGDAGRFDDALIQAEHAFRLNPLDQRSLVNLVVCLGKMERLPAQIIQTMVGQVKKDYPDGHRLWRFGQSILAQYPRLGGAFILRGHQLIRLGPVTNRTTDLSDRLPAPRYPAR